MSFMGFFPNEQERRLAREEAAYAVEKHGDRAAEVLADKAAQSRKEAIAQSTDWLGLWCWRGSSRKLATAIWRPPPKN